MSANEPSHAEGPGVGAGLCPERRAIRGSGPAKGAHPVGGPRGSVLQVGSQTAQPYHHQKLSHSMVSAKGAIEAANYKILLIHLSRGCSSECIMGFYEGNAHHFEIAQVVVT